MPNLYCLAALTRLMEAEAGKSGLPSTLKDRNAGKARQGKWETWRAGT